ncbi:hypothetical protein HNQ07_003826 [Deinococcus metalli]|uniref:DUF6504 domain-containing protein n=1 Tax=Deinococcus metalli TaxID=1141878 RepID=A0A7W8NRX3_9DEIO|nr:DUF6504 family protein [Deinococcus metalli]MBB5378320.1 hypothetical protein [Deinococcus metalli]GHF59737.1 hypothetical protein GCM10017781_40110 [Deinococcus metalli]
MRAVEEEVHVQLSGGTPQVLLWRARRYRVSGVLDEWRAAGRWWRRDPPRDYWLLRAGPLTAEVYHVRSAAGDAWVLSRLAD